MRRKKTMALLSTLNKKEFAEFEKYLKLNLANQKKVLATFNYLKRFYPRFSDKKRLEIDYAYRRIFKTPIDSNPHNRKNFLNILSDINRCLKSYMVLNKINTPSLEGRLVWLFILMERNFSGEFARGISMLKSMIEKLTIKKVSGYFMCLITNYLYYYKVIQNKTDPGIDAIKNCISSLDNYYLIVRMKLACELAARESILKTNYTEDNELINYIDKVTKSCNTENPLIIIYAQAYQLIKTNDIRHFYKLESLLRKHSDEIDTEEKHIVLSYLQNYNSSLIRQKQESAWLKAHELNKFGVEQGLFSRKGLISSTQFNNIVNAASKAKDFDWAFDFVEKHKNFLDEKIRDNTTKLSQAIIYYEMNRFEEVLSITLKLEFLDSLYTIRAKALTLIAYFELKWDKRTTLNFCSSFMAYLKRNKNLKRETLIATANFIKITRDLIQSRLPKKVLMEKIKKTELLYFNLWLLEKTKSLN